MRIYSVMVILLTIALFYSTLGQTVQFKVPIAIQSGKMKDTLWVGVSGDGPGGKILDNTYDLDVDKAYGSVGQWCEQMYPPDFPNENFKSKFIDIPGRSQINARGGMRPYDFRGFTSLNQIDSFAIRVYGENIAKGPLLISWPKNLDLFGNSWQLLKKERKKYTVVVSNMISTTSYTDPNEGSDERLDYLLIKAGVKKK